MKRMIVGLLLLLFLAGCASNLDRGKSLINQGNYGEAIEYLEASSEEGLDELEVDSKLAIAYYKNRQYEKAEEKLKSIIDRDPNNPTAHMYLGMIYETEQLYEDAIKEYEKYIALCPFDEIRQQFRARLDLLKLKAVAQIVRNDLEDEANLPVDRVDPDTFAVKYFHKLYGPPELDVLEKGLTDLLISDLAQIEGIKVVERTKLQNLVNEIKLRENSSLITPETSPRVGKLLGAGNIITGTLEGTEQGESTLKITAAYSRIDISEHKTTEEVGKEEGDFLKGVFQFVDKLLDTGNMTEGTDQEEGAPGVTDYSRIGISEHKITEEEGFLKEVFELEKKVLVEILKDAGIEISPQKLEELGQPTRSFEAFLLYSRGLDYMDQGFYDDAAKQFQNAIALDPEFSSALENLTTTQNLSTAIKQDLGEIEKAVNKAEEDMRTTSERGSKSNSVLSKGFMQFPGTSYNASDISPKEEADSESVEFTIKW